MNASPENGHPDPAAAGSPNGSPTRHRARVFLGPTISHEDARTVLGDDRADYRPPVVLGDIDQAWADGVEVVGIIDAAFIHTYTATPTELLQSIRRGMVLFGAASAGALRAAELDRFGMRGVGSIYEQFKAGFEAEDELAVAFDPSSLRVLSEAMVNVRSVCAGALAEGVIEQADHDTLITAARATYFAERTYRGMVAAARLDGAVGRSFLAWVDEHRGRYDRKRADAIACLQAIELHLDQAR